MSARDGVRTLTSCGASARACAASPVTGVWATVARTARVPEFRQACRVNVPGAGTQPVAISWESGEAAAATTFAVRSNSATSQSPSLPASRIST